jgi:hypothetical protein
MKKYIYAVLALSLFTLNAVAQTNEQATPDPLPAWLSHKGYWVIESNVKTPKKSTVHFYNNEHVAIYREKVEGVRLNLNRKKTLMRLKNVLDKALVKWEATKTINKDEQLVMNAFR